MNALIKTDTELASEARALVDALVGKMAEMLSRGLVCQIGMDNGAQSKKVMLTMFKVDKEIAAFTAPTSVSV